MLKLLKKDLSLTIFNKKNIVFYIFYIPILFIISEYLEFKWLYFVALYGSTYLMSTESLLYDMANYTINSLPINRKEIVISRYISTFIYFIIDIVYTGVYLWIINFLGIADVDYFNLEMIKMVLPIILISTSIVYLAYFDLESSLFSKIYIFVFVIFFMGVTRLGEIGKMSLLGRVLFLNGGKYISIIAIILYLLLLFMSINVYETKDL